MTQHVLSGVEPWARGDVVALATVVSTFGSAPTPVGTGMAIAADGEVWGSVSGGCVEGDVHARGLEVISSGEPELVTYGVSDEDAGQVGLTCGGTIEVFIEAVSRATSPELADFVDSAQQGSSVTVATIVHHDDPHLVGQRIVVGGLSASQSDIPARLTGAMVESAHGFLASGRTGSISYGPLGERRGQGTQVTFSTATEAPRMIVFGATDFGAAVTRVGKLLGFHVTLCDARETFATPGHFPDADAIVVDWPHRYLGGQVELGKVDNRTVVCVLSHDLKFDVPLLALALTLPDHIRPNYIGAMGSRRTHSKRIAELKARGVDDDALARLSSPIGLDLGARTPDETAVSIAAEIVASRWGGTGARLSTITSPVHPEPTPNRGQQTRTVGLLLAAGAGTRMGMPKALATAITGESWVLAASRVLATGGCDEVYVAVGAEHERVSETLSGSGVHVIQATEWAEGVGATLRQGLEVISGSDADAVLVHLVDLPDIGPDVIRRVGGLAAPDALARATYSTTPGHPVLIGRSHWAPLILELEGDHGANAYLARHGVVAVDCSDLAHGADIDSPKDLEPPHLRFGDADADRSHNRTTQSPSP